MNPAGLHSFTYLARSTFECGGTSLLHQFIRHPDKNFDDSITIFSPGTLFGGLTLEDLKTDYYQSCTRNKLIAEAFYQTNNIEKYGSGYIRIRRELTEYPEIVLDIKELDGGMLACPASVGNGLSGRLI